MKGYTKHYFEKRDHLNVHIAMSIEILMRDNNLTKVLDVGCGTGRLVKFLNQHGFDAFGSDLYEQAVIAARKINKKNTIMKASATKLPFKNQSFDLVTGISVIEHLTQRESQKFLKESHRILKPNGFIFMITPNYASPLRLIFQEKWFGYSDPTHINFFTPRHLSYLLKYNGFKNVRLWFKTRYREEFDRKFPSLFSKLPVPIKKLGIYLLFSTPLSLVRDSFWIAAQKNE